MSRRKRCATLSKTAESYLTAPLPPVRVSRRPIARLYAHYCGPVKEPCRSGYEVTREGGPGRHLDGTASAARPPEPGVPAWERWRHASAPILNQYTRVF